MASETSREIDKKVIKELFRNSLGDIWSSVMRQLYAHATKSSLKKRQRRKMRIHYETQKNLAFTFEEFGFFRSVCLPSRFRWLQPSTKPFNF